MSSVLAQRRVLLVGLAVLLVVLLVAGKLLARTRTAGAPVEAPVAPATTAAEPQGEVVHVVGSVRRPGLYRLAHGARVADALARAGGATRKADLTLVNLAALVADGEQVIVPARGGAAPAGAAAPSAGPTAGPVHLNSATVEQLDALPGVGPVTAAKIVDYRQEHGGFSSVDDLDAIPGIGPARLDQLRDIVAP